MAGTAGELFRQCPELVIPGRDVLRAQALVELATGLMPPEPTRDTTHPDSDDAAASPESADHDATDPPDDTDETDVDEPDVADATGEPAVAAGGGRAGGLDGRLVLPPGWRPAPRRGRVEATFVVLGNQPGHLLTPDGLPLHDHWARAIACDVELHPIVTNTLGVPLDAGRSIRHANLAQRRAIAQRDGGCTFPGCPHPVVPTPPQTTAGPAPPCQPNG